MERNFTLYRKLFTSTFYLSAFTFGGGYVIVPLMRKEFVEKQKWIDEKEMMDMVAIAQSSPGALAVNASVIIGYRCGGVLGALVTVFGTILPPLIILSVISYFYEAFVSIKWIQIMLFGMQAGVAAVICDVVWTMAKEVASQPQKIYIAVMLIAFFANVVLHLHLLIIIIGCGILGFLIERYAKRRPIQ